MVNWLQHLRTLTNRNSDTDALEEIHVWKQSHDELARLRAENAVMRAASESAERRELLAELVQLGAEREETLHRWQNADLENLREYVQAARGARVMRARRR